MSETTQQEYSGTPVEVGTALAADALNPTIQEAINSGVSDQQLAGMLTGIVLFAAGTAAMTVGHGLAVEMMRQCLDHLEKSAPAGGDRVSHH
jgi:hypothetical protein